MNQIKMAGDLAADVSREISGAQSTEKKDTTDIRALDELELMLVGGGDGTPVWG
jgi:hypothetical protein